MRKSKNTLFLSFICMLLIGAFSFLDYGDQYFAKNFFESDTFQSQYNDFTNRLGPLVLNPLDTAQAKKNIRVTSSEIEEYRNYYGSLSEQIANINEQYKDKIEEAKNAKSTSVEKALITERDKKVKDITKNFEDDDYVFRKIVKIKEEEIDQYDKNVKEQKQEFLNNYDYFSYELTDLQTGQTFTSGNYSQDDVVYTHTYKKNQNVFQTSTIDNNYAANLDDNKISFDIKEAIPNTTHQYTGEIRISKSAFMNSYYYHEYKTFQSSQRLLVFIWILSLLSSIALFFNRPLKFEMKKEISILRVIRKWPIDVRAMGLLITGYGVIIDLLILSDHLTHVSFTNIFSFIAVLIIGILVLYLLVWFVLMQFFLLIEDMNTEEKRLIAYKSSVSLRVVQNLRNLFLSRSIGLQSVALLIIVFLSGVGIVGAVYDGGLLLIYIFLFFTIALPAVLIFLLRIGYLNRIMKQTEDMAEGRLNSEIKVQGKSVFAKHAANLNQLREGVRTSLSEQAKSERLKTELITNVSHDLRTPLTSIITYTDLLKNPNITEDERNSYIAILDKKSQRLKTLIEDLFEVSKMASGNMELQKQKVNLNQLLQQALGEHEEDMDKAEIDFRIQITDEVLMAYVDGQKWWRMLDNLIINALKYTLEGTRVYISLNKVEQHAQFVIKNITKYELGDQNVEELFERFKRADTSRHTDGSGLGLAISQSIVDLHEGKMDITIDGDLFKVTVNVPII
ncbi:sensor histidine kinase [Rummeliibacillus pycnus]|uniref:sensor histidine kinase n=1 Tax=Rummeliibacillus pycnus TaxID=101070 RepID=UPI000C999465|nr:HAMP domain-containing sensor histidine kinase [Rummeliibacillus pycnus]